MVPTCAKRTKPPTNHHSRPNQTACAFRRCAHAAEGLGYRHCNGLRFSPDIASPPPQLNKGGGRLNQMCGGVRTPRGVWLARPRRIRPSGGLTPLSARRCRSSASASTPIMRSSSSEAKRGRRASERWFDRDEISHHAHTAHTPRTPHESMAQGAAPLGCRVAGGVVQAAAWSCWSFHRLRPCRSCERASAGAGAGAGAARAAAVVAIVI